jgi:hypothetical protein
MFFTGRHIDRNPANGDSEATYALCKLLQYGDEGGKPDLEPAAIWAQQSVE